MSRMGAFPRFRLPVEVCRDKKENIMIHNRVIENGLICSESESGI